MASLTLPSIPAKLSWRNQPLVGNVELENSLSISAGSATDWFLDPGGNTTKRNAPVALFAAPDENLLLAAKVTVEFASNFDAGVCGALVGTHAVVHFPFGARMAQ